MKVALVDLKKQYLSIKMQIDAAVQKVINQTDFIQGEDVAKFEEEFANYLSKGREEVFCASCANGTDSIYLSLRALGIGPGDEVVTVSHTFAATAEAICQVGAVAVFVDIDEKTMLMDPTKIEASVTCRTRAVLIVHLYGQPCDMDPILDIVRRRGLYLIEDVAQAHGATWKGQRVGTFGDLACFSFYPGKNLGAYGDAGAVVSKNKVLINRVKLLANHGRIDKYEHLIEGVNSRLDTLQAAVLRVKLKYLDNWNLLRQNHAQFYLHFLRDMDLLPPFSHKEAISVWHLFVIRVSHRDQLLDELKKRGVMAGIHYPTPLHLQKAFSKLGYQRNDFPVTEKSASTIISLPIYPEMTEKELHFVIKSLEESLVICV